MREYGTVLVIDPGKTTGLAFGERKDGYFTYNADQATLRCKSMWELLHRLEPDNIVYEDFTFRQGKTGVDYYPLILIGVIELYVELRGESMLTAVGLTVQNPSVLRTWPNPRLKEEGAYTVGKEHARDAARHLLQWYYFNSSWQIDEKGHERVFTPFL